MKVQVNLNDELVAKIDVLTKQLGVSRSAFCAMMIAQGSLGMFKVCDLVDGLTLKDFGIVDSGKENNVENIEKK